MTMAHTRRTFLRSALGAPALLTFGGVSPGFLLSAAEEQARRGGDRVLVVVQLSGGNDGLNTIVPHTDDQYRKHRPTLAIPRSDVLTIDDDSGFHPALTGFVDLLQASRLAIVQGVGYDNPNRSHFESMDIWHSGVRKDQPRSAGWLGRYLDVTRAEANADVSAIHLGAEKQPFALTARDVRVPSVRSLEEFRLRVPDEEATDVIRSLAESTRKDSGSLLDFVQSSTTGALDVSEQIRVTDRGYTPQVNYPDSALAQKLKTVARLIDAGLRTRVYYVEIDGFDTHSQQAAAHTGLLRQLGDAASAFVTDMIQQGHGDRVLVMCFSEFGRRVAENASEGTDHGAAAPVFLAGERVVAGRIGAHPSLADLDEGDLKHHTDFRQVYATVLQDWLHCDSQQILGAPYSPVPAIRT
jgi:uncharacterized protein (DUF1501 family)